MKHKEPSQRRLPVWKRVKTMCIWILLGCNLLTAAVFAVDGIQNTLEERHTQSQMDAVLSRQGIISGSSVYRTLRTAPQAYLLRMDSTQQTRFAEAFLKGELSASPEKNNAVMWNGQNGSITWSATGEINGVAEMQDIEEPTDLDSARKMIAKLLQTAEMSVKKEEIQAYQSAENTILVEVKQFIDGIEILGAKLSFTIQTGNHVEISGKWCTGTPETLYMQELDSYSSERVLVQLMRANTGMAQIISAQPVYLLSDRSGGRFQVTPCWRISADNGDFVLNILTGDVIASSEIGIDSKDDTDGNDSDEILFPDEEQTPEGDLQPDDNQGEMDEDSDWTTGILGPGNTGT